MNLLLHTCCAPCLIYPLKQLRAKGYQVVSLFYNPNIHPFVEYNNRRKALEDFAKRADIEVIYFEYRPQDFFQAINLKETAPQRCHICWSLRLKKTAQVAKEKLFEYFSTTLLVSPYQNQDSLKRIGFDISKETGVSFYYQDFRAGFREAHLQAKEMMIYCQQYCGCIYSEVERCTRSAKP
ncbi:MAG: epoxyqueuosine reductase QueH [Candidatus Omnitrophica bacterium]|nr:epoxyqueuosine reductase QueH [Candidatus Omnitrophota bacterium]